MLKVKLLRNLLLLSLVMAVLFPAFEILYVHPSYHHLLIQETEDEAVRYARQLAQFLDIDKQFLSRDTLPDQFANRIAPLGSDQRLIKFRVFSATGEIVFSTDTQEIGRVNERDYFRNIVAKGQVYSKVVQKDKQTADGVATKQDVVETYVPFMVDGAFGGAFEVYYDITSGIAKVRALTLHSLLILLGMIGVFLVSLWIALRGAASSLTARDEAEAALLQANEALENRVAERTEELSQANVQLTNEIAERTLAQMALSEALEDSRRDREKLDGILRSVADGLVVTDASLHVMHMNAAAEKLLGLPLERALGKSLRQVSQDVDFLAKVEETLADPAAKMLFEFELPGNADGGFQIYQARLFHLADEPESQGVILLIRNITREREVERMKSAFLGMAAHELNTPLAAVLGFAELLSNPELVKTLSDGQVQEYLELIHVKALSLSRLVDDLLDISQIESGRSLNLSCEDFVLDELIRNVTRPYQEHNGEHDFEIQVSGGPIQLHADPGRLRQVLDNLLSNAVKYSPRGGRVRVMAALKGESCQVVISDEGIGMTPEQVSCIFDRFYRVDSSNTAVQGVGLGMSIVQHIVHAHNGEIDVSSELGKGTTVAVTLPRSCAAEQSQAG